MNKAILMGRLTRDPEVRYSQGERSIAIARYTLAVDRRGRRDQNNGPTADFIPCVAFDRAGEFAEKYFRQGQRVLIEGHIQTGSYTNRDGATPIVMGRRSTPPRSWSIARSLQTARTMAEAATTTPSRAGKLITATQAVRASGLLRVAERPRVSLIRVSPMDNRVTGPEAATGAHRHPQDNTSSRA